MDLIAQNAATLSKELEWLEAIIRERMGAYMSNSDDLTLLQKHFEQIPDLSGDSSGYAKVIKHYDFGAVERLVIALALAPHLRPQTLDLLWQNNPETGRSFTEVGGLKATQHGGVLPTGETAIFLLAGTDIESRIRLQRMFEPNQVLGHYKIVYLDASPAHEPLLSGLLRISKEYLDLFTTGVAGKPNFDQHFPARLLETELEWEDLVLPANVRDQIEVICTWVQDNSHIFETWEASRMLKMGYRALFYGPPGTGKTLTASLIGKQTGNDVYIIDASMVVSKWVGETEKNLARVFDMAENKDWILFFDEADSLLGKRSSQDSGHERYGNQQTSYLLQRIENYSGTVILASNLKGNIDAAFLRRFQSVIYFPLPTIAQRLELWERIFSAGLPFSHEVDLKQVAGKYELSGGNMVNVLKYVAIKAKQRAQGMVYGEDLLEGIRQEMVKEGKQFG